MVESYDEYLKRQYHEERDREWLKTETITEGLSYGWFAVFVVVVFGILGFGIVSGVMQR